MGKSNASRPKISLNLGGGGTRGLAHIGVLKALKENDIEFDMIIGVSMGALVGLNYALNPDPWALEKKVTTHVASDEFKDSLLGSWRQRNDVGGRNLLLRINRLYKQTGLVGRLLLSQGVLSEDDVEDALFPIIPNVKFSSLKVPFVCTAVNLETGTIRIFKDGMTRIPALASASLPLVFPPVYIDSDPYIDGGVLDKIGIDTAKQLGIKTIIAIDVSNTKTWRRKISTGIEVMLRADEIAARYRKDIQLNDAAMVIYPIKEDIHWADFSKVYDIIEMGYQSTLEMIPQIRKKTRRLKLGFFFFGKK